MTNLKGPPATSKARPTTSEGAWEVFFQIMPPCRQYLFIHIFRCSGYLKVRKFTTNSKRKGYPVSGKERHRDMERAVTELPELYERNWKIYRRYLPVSLVGLWQL